MKEPLVRIEARNDVTRITLNRPQKRNALTRDLISQFLTAVDEAADSGARLIILAAEGPVFCAGMDLAEMQTRAQAADSIREWQEDTRMYRNLLVSLLALHVPTLAVVQGPALAGGLGLILACDMVLAAESAFVGLPEPKRGITAAIVAPLLAFRIGAGRASYLLLCGENITAENSYRLGLFHDVVSGPDLAGREEQLTASILSGSPIAMAATKRCIMDSVASPLIEQIDAGMRISALARESSDAREGLSAFLEKRNPAWQPTSPPKSSE